MATLIRRVLTVLVGLVALLLAAQGLLTRDSKPAPPNPNEKPTRPVTIRDLLEANVPVPTRSRVSFPKFTYRQAFPEATDSPEYVVETFDQAPMLKNLDAMEGDWRKFYPAGLPPVEERLPRNPAVVVGPDDQGQYGGSWRMCATGATDLTRKLGYESLTRFDPSGNQQPCLAYKWEVSPDSRAFTFYLRKGHRWSDGEPFTAHDVAWVANVNIGSPHWNDPPDWMQPTDGSLLLYEDDVPDWKALCGKIVQQAAASGPSVGKQIQTLGEARLWKGIGDLAAGSADAEAPGRVTDQLNEVFRNPAFFAPAAFAAVDLGAELKELQGKGASSLSKEELERLLLMEERQYTLSRFQTDPNSLDGSLLNRMNLLAFRSAYRGMVEPARQQRVQVDCVPDANGDDSHIVRFTFRKPNSIFLEQTGTFMFYRGLFNMPFHWVKKIHPDATRELALTDFWDWEAFTRNFLAQVDAPGPSAGKQLWKGLSEALQQKLRASPPGKDAPEAYRQELVDAFNQVLARPDFFDPAAWKGVDLRKPKDAASAGKGWEKLSREQAARLEYRDWVVVEDLARRVAQGDANFTADQKIRLNVAMFRAAFYAEVPNMDDPKASPAVTRTRAVGLDLAAKRQPAKYAGWVQQMRDRENYHPVYNPHAAVLQAWRPVSQKDAPEILAVRNPYYYRVDSCGRQLPYIDAIKITVSTQKEIRILKMKSGNVDFQTRDIGFDEYTVLKQNEEKGGYKVLLWANDDCGEATFSPLQARKEPVFLKLNEDPNFRHALSLALNRREISDVVYFGLSQPAVYSVPEGSPYYSRRMATVSTEFDPNRANRLLDEMGLSKRAADGTRLLWDGTPMILDVDSTGGGGDVPQSVLRLACQYWQNIGINAQMKIRTSRLINRMMEMGTEDILASKAGGSFFGPMLPGSFYPSNAAECGWWYNWALYMRNGGRSGWAAPERIKELERMWQKLVTSPTREAKMAAWKAVTDRFATDLPLIGILTSPGKVVYVRNGFKNVPPLALAGWIAHEPGNTCPECYYFENP